MSPPVRPLVQHSLVPVVFCLFFVSGIVGLGYQVVWSKYLHQIIGVGAYAYATVLATFMAGLAIGAVLLGRVADRVRKPLVLFATLELGIAVYSLLFPSVISLATEFYEFVRAGIDVDSTSLWSVGGRALVAAIVLLPPTVLMGATLPALVRHVTQSADAIGRRVAQLYGLNAGGAALGSIVSGYGLLPALGLEGALATLALGNLVVAILAVLIAAASSTPGASSPEVAPARDTPTTHPSASNSGRYRAVVWLVFAAGIVSFLFETAWIRFFGIALGSSTYSFSVMLAALISGIAVGSWSVSRSAGADTDPLQTFARAQLLVALSVALLLPIYPYLPWFFGKFASLLSREADAFTLYEIGKFAFCFAIMFLPSIFIGMSIPLAIRAIAARVENLGETTGRVYAWNTWGNVLGAVAGGLVLLPSLGMEWLLRVSVLASIAIGVAALLVTAKTHATAAPPKARRARGLAIGLVAASAFLGTPWDVALFTIMPYRRLPLPSWEQLPEWARPVKVLFAEDDPAAHLLVTDIAGRLTLFVNGKADAGNRQDMATQILVGQIPLFWHPRAGEPLDVLVIGLASGITAGAALSHPLRRLDCVEIVKAMPKATRFFSNENRNALSDPRLRVIIDDARAVTGRANQQYDVIISEPSNPWIAGVGSLFTTEFYKKAARALRSDGVLVQWFNLYDVSNWSLAAVVRSLEAAFPHVVGFEGNKNDLLLLASSRPLAPDSSRIERLFREPAIAESLRRIGIASPAALLFTQQIGAQAIREISSMAINENTDDNRFLEINAPKEQFQKLVADLPNLLDERRSPSPSLTFFSYRSSVRLPPDIELLMLFQSVHQAMHYDDPLPVHLLKVFYRMVGSWDRLPDAFKNSVNEEVRRRPPERDNAIRPIFENLARDESWPQLVELVEKHRSLWAFEARWFPERIRAWAMAVAKLTESSQLSASQRRRFLRAQAELAIAAHDADLGRQALTHLSAEIGDDYAIALWTARAACGIGPMQFCARVRANLRRAFPAAPVFADR